MRHVNPPATILAPLGRQDRAVTDVRAEAALEGARLLRLLGLLFGLLGGSGLRAQGVDEPRVERESRRPLDGVVAQVLRRAVARDGGRDGEQPNKPQHGARRCRRSDVEALRACYGQERAPPEAAHVGGVVVLTRRGASMAC